MNFSIYQLGEIRPAGSEDAVRMLNRTQTLWRLVWLQEAKPPSFDAHDNLLALTQSRAAASSASNFVIGVTAGRVDIQGKLFLIDHGQGTAIVSEYEWKRESHYDPPEVFWALALASICFQASIGASCESPKCLGYRESSFDQLLLRLLNLEICESCLKQITTRYKYHVPEMRGLLETIRRPSSYVTSAAYDDAHLPVLERQIRRLTDSGFRGTFEKYGLVLVMHFLRDLVPFVRGLTELGAREESMALVVKPYPYSERTHVHSVFCDRYRKIRKEYLTELPPSDELLHDVVEYCRSKSSSGKLLVVEDGGYVVPFLHANYGREEAVCVGAVEQTTKGLRRDRDIQDFHFPVLNVAKSKFKDEYESPLVGRAAVLSIQRLLPDESFSAKNALVFGFGSVGREVADSLRAIGMVVTVCDKDARRVVAASVRGFRAVTDPSPELVERATLLIGTVGEKSMGEQVLENLTDGAILASTSSDRVEIDIDHLKVIAQASRYQEGLGTWYTRRDGNQEDKYLLLADGFPVNFYSGGGIPNRAIDPILAQLFVGAVQLARNSDMLQPGILDVMDDVIEERKLLDDFLHTYEH